MGQRKTESKGLFYCHQSHNLLVFSYSLTLFLKYEYYVKVYKNIVHTKTLCHYTSSHTGQELILKMTFILLSVCVSRFQSEASNQKQEFLTVTFQASKKKDDCKFTWIMLTLTIGINCPMPLLLPGPVQTVDTFGLIAMFYVDRIAAKVANTTQ